MARPGPRSLAGDREVAAGGHGLPDLPGHASGPAPPPVDQPHDGGQARTVNTTHTESAIPRWGRTRAALRSVARTLASAPVPLIMGEAAVAAGVMRRSKTGPVG